LTVLLVIVDSLRDTLSGDAACTTTLNASVAESSPTAIRIRVRERACSAIRDVLKIGTM
jgi:hypothetical protein